MRTKATKNKAFAQSVQRVGLPIKIKKKAVKKHKVLKKIEDKKEENDEQVEDIHHIENEGNNNEYDEIINNYYLKVEKDKMLIMWSGVTFFMILIISFWVYNTKLSFQNINSGASQVPKFEFDKLSNQISEKMEEIEKNVNDVKDQDVEETPSQEEQIQTDNNIDKNAVEELKNTLQKKSEQEN